MWADIVELCVRFRIREVFVVVVGVGTCAEMGVSVRKGCRRQDRGILLCLRGEVTGVVTFLSTLKISLSLLDVVAVFWLGAPGRMTINFFNYAFPFSCILKISSVNSGIAGIAISVDVGAASGFKIVIGLRDLGYRSRKCGYPVRYTFIGRKNSMAVS